MSGPVFDALSGDPVLAQHYADFRAKAEGALAPGLVAMIRQAVAQVHGLEAAAIDDTTLDHGTRVCIAYARRMPFEHTAISDAEGKARGMLRASSVSALSSTATVATILCGAASKVPGEKTIT